MKKEIETRQNGRDQQSPVIERVKGQAGKVYQKPELIRCGDLSSLTLGGANNIQDGDFTGTGGT